MKRSFLAEFDVRERQQKTLDYVLGEEARAKKNAVVGPKVSIAEARTGEAHYTATSDRETTRLLILSQETAILNQTTQSIDGYLNLSDVFDEVHIVVLQIGLPATNPVLRVEANVWLYVVSAPDTLALIAQGKDTLKQQLEFADGFRADLIVARDPFVSAWLALWAGKKYTRPTQLHITKDYTLERSFKKFTHPKLMRLWYRYTSKRFRSIRTTTDALTDALITHLGADKDIATLPRFHNFAATTLAAATIDIKEKYRQFSFIILYIGELHFGAKAFQAIDAARNLMRSPKVGLVILGDGDARLEFIKRAELLGIGTQVVFEKSTDDVISYLKSADILLVPDTDEGADELAIAGAAAGIPLVIADTAVRRDLFLPDESALFFTENVIMEMSSQMKKVLNDPGVSERLVRIARDVVVERLHEDPLQYKLSYRDSIEGALFVEDSEPVK